MKLIRCLCTTLALAALPLAADPLSFVVLDGTTPGALLRYSEHGVTTIATLAAGGVGLTKDLKGNYMVVNGSTLFRVTPTGTVSTIVNVPSGSPNPQWVAVTADPLGSDLIAADNAQHAIWKIIAGSPFSLVAKIANYTVSNSAAMEDVEVLVDNSGNYVVLEDNSSTVQMFSITPAGTVTPIPLSGASVTSVAGLVPDGAGNYLFASWRENALYRLTPTGVVTQVAQSVTSGVLNHVGSIALNPDNGDIFVYSYTGQLLQVSADGSLITTIANPAAGSHLGVAMVAETYGALPHLAAGDVWTTGFYVLNTGNRPASYSISFYGDSGSPISLPFSGGSASTLQGTLPARGMTYVEAANPTAPLAVASGLISADATITVQALFRDHSADGNYYEAGVPASAGSNAFSIPFDATTFAATGVPLYTGFGLANLDPTNSATVTCVATDNTGATLPSGLLVTLPPLGHYSGYSGYNNFPALTGSRGTLTCSASSTVSAVALRFIGNAAFSSLPVLYK
jgi:hypothetical protein